MSDEFAAILDRIAGHSDWDEFDAPPEGDPSFGRWVHAMVAPAYPSPRLELAECARKRYRTLKGGSPPIEAQGEHTTQYGPVPLEFMEFGWRYRRDLRRLVGLDRNHREFGPAFYKPRPVVSDIEKQERVAAWVAGEVEAGRAVKPDELDARERCGAVVGFDVPRKMLREVIRRRGAARGRGRPSNSRK